jgi:NitT/TauT family transport system permease protein
MGWSTRLRSFFDPIVAALHPIPKISVLPLIMVVFGIGEVSRLVIVAIASFFPMLINSMAGVLQINPIYFDVAKNYGAGRLNLFRRLILPGSLPFVLTGARLALNSAFVITIVVEMVFARQGVGQMIFYAWQTFRIEELYASILVISVFGITLNFLLRRLKRLVVPWHDSESG